MKFAVVGVVFLVAVCALLWISVVKASIQAYDVPEVLSSAYSGEECRVDKGKVVRIDNWVDPLRFTIASESAPQLELNVVTRRHPPDNLKEGGSVAIRGRYDRSQGVFKAVEVTTKCPTKYEGKEQTSNGGSGSYTPGAGDDPAMD